MKINNRIIQDNLACKYKSFLKIIGEVGLPHEFELLEVERSRQYRLQATERLLQRLKLESAPAITSATTDDLNKGFALIRDCTIDTDQLVFFFDALRRVDGKSRLGSFHYLPVLYHSGYTVRTNQRLMIAIACVVLAQVQGVYPRRLRQTPVRRVAKLYNSGFMSHSRENRV
ncbi:hypothetical protein Enr13x_20540 [Stieleria neptunia]|uniref:Uncharacterized protein n=1 Tax=Stieleria neptunia TaxID=2527979 RepID=A0A518HN17_9BACT|nr:hypothetical protein [Stieleria neptunia]QDV42209.1 hypothetical protein Enr13x_20540 [Stieleria neptunia]